MARHPHPTAKIRVGKWPHSPHGTIYIDVDANDGTGAKVTLEIRSDHVGSMMVKMHPPHGRVHLCSPVQCVWSSQNPQDRTDLEKYLSRVRGYPVHLEES